MFLGWVSWKPSLRLGSGTGESLRESSQVQREGEKQGRAREEIIKYRFYAEAEPQPDPLGGV